MTATYRLQLHAGFTFADAGSVVPYLADLGVSHLYLSPVLRAVPGSMHGYDVLDHRRVSPELGGQEGLVALAATAREHGLGLVVDVVPNHMALVAPESANAPLWDVLAHGRDAAHAHWFDVDWDALGGRLGLPLLGEPVADAVAKGDLRLDHQDGEPVLRYHEHVFPVADSTWDGSPEADVEAVLDRQHYLLADWHERGTVLNYRRFFEVDGLVAVRVEDPDVFEATHRVLLDLNHRGLVEGFRIDHPDGLADPGGYLEALRAATLPGTAIWVEKILEGHEDLPDWPCDGTTGYDALKAVTSALTDPATAPALDAWWRRTGGDPSVSHVVADAKRVVVDELLVPERARLVRRAADCLPDVDAHRLDAAVAELLVACEVYRAYVRPGHPADDAARTRLSQAVERATAARPDLEDVLGRLLGLALLDGAPMDDGADPEAARDFAVRLQQTWGPVMAKGIEDTAFYRYHRLVALNEVGGDPDLLETASADDLHDWARRQQASWPLGMTTLSTHDTKRSEDVRARVLALAGDGETWGECADAFAEEGERLGVDAPTAYLVWQTLAGVGDITDERLSDYLLKSVRESKEHTSWLEPDPAYEERVLELAREAAGPGLLGAAVRAATEANHAEVRALVLGQKLLQLTVPGVPDTYQGCELVDLSLVDPDNRRPVDFEDRRDRLARLRAGEAPRDLSDEKLHVVHRALRLRREVPAAFREAGDYAPLVATSRHAVGFTRGEDVAVLVTRAPRRLDVTGGWGGATVTLPGGFWRDELTSTLHEGGSVACGDLLTTYPVALLRKVDMA